MVLLWRMTRPSGSVTTAKPAASAVIFFAESFGDACGHALILPLVGCQAQLAVCFHPASDVGPRRRRANDGAEYVGPYALRMTEWIPLAVAIVAPCATIAVQLVIGRGEPAAIKRIKLLSEAIETMPDGDEGRSKMVEARTHMAKRLAKSLVGLTGFARVLRVSAWVSLAIGTVVLVGFVIIFTVAEPTNDIQVLTSGAFAISLTLLVLSPVLLLYSAMWPQFETTIREARALIVERRRSKRETPATL